MAIPDDEQCDRALRAIGYFRLSGYWYPLREPVWGTRDDGSQIIVGRVSAFVEAASFEHVMSLWEFDFRLRSLILEAIERIEIQVRVACSYVSGSRGPFAHLDADLMDGKFTSQATNQDGVPQPSRHERWLASIREQQGIRDDDFVVHHEVTYGGDLPIWTLVEVLEMGQLMQLFSGLPWKEKVAVTDLLRASEPETLTGWLAAVNKLRNKAAHQSRLWNAGFETPKRARRGALPEMDHLRDIGKDSGIYAHICILKYWMGVIEAGSSWHDRLDDLLRAFPDVPFQTLHNAGFPRDWTEQQLWNV